MNSLISSTKELTLDSREVAEMVDKNHAHLLRDIDIYLEYFLTNPNLDSSHFFIEGTYIAGNGEERRKYNITKKGCEFIAHKLTGAKGTIFTAAYIHKFHQMENTIQMTSLNHLSPQLQLLISMELEQKEIKKKTEVLEHRFNSLDATNIEGTPRQRLNDMIRKYAYDHGVIYAEAWKRFRRNFNTAYKTNIELRKNNYMDEHMINKLSYPEYMEEAGLIEDALRVADKMLNR